MSQSVEHIRAEILRVITKHEPDNIDEIDNLMKQYKGTENNLLKNLCDKYKEIYSEMSPISIVSTYSIGSKFRTGGGAVIRKVRRRSDGLIFANKIINKSDRELLGGKIEMEKEINILRNISHPNIAKLYNVFDSKTITCLILDLCEGGDLFYRIIEKGHFNENYAKQIFGKLCKALKYLHSQYIVHRDIRPKKILFVTKDDNSFIKLIGFGIAAICKNNLLSTPCGTPNYIAPEILKRQKYGTKVDMWSAGVILYIILCGFPPFYDENNDLENLYRKIKTAEYDMPSPYWDNISNDAKDLVQKLLQLDPKERLSATEVLKHRWIKASIDKILNNETIIDILNEINDKNKLLVFGYIRNQINLHIPSTITSYIVIFAFYE